jgi:translation initiation factor IF-2
VPIVLRLNQINSPLFQSALNTLAQSKDLKDINAAYNVSRILRQIRAALDEARRHITEKAKDFMEPLHDEPEKMVIRADRKGDFEAMLAEFVVQEITIESHKIKLADLHQTKLTPDQILALDCLIEA